MLFSFLIFVLGEGTLLLSYPILFLDLHVAIAFGLFFRRREAGRLVRSSPLWSWRGMLGADGCPGCAVGLSV